MIILYNHKKKSNSFNLMAYCNLYIQSRDHHDLDNGSTHGLCKPHMPHAWIVISEHLVNNAVDFNHFLLKHF